MCKFLSFLLLVELYPLEFHPGPHLRSAVVWPRPFAERRKGLVTLLQKALHCAEHLAHQSDYSIHVFLSPTMWSHILRLFEQTLKPRLMERDCYCSQKWTIRTDFYWKSISTYIVEGWCNVLSEKVMQYSCWISVIKGVCVEEITRRDAIDADKQVWCKT